MTTIGTNLLNQSEPSLTLSPADYAFISVHACLFVAIVVTNVVTLIVIATTPRLQTISNMYITSLAVSDLLVAVEQLMFIPWRHPAYHRHFEESWPLCCFMIVFVYLAESTSLITVVLIAVDRLLYIKFPFFYLRAVTKRKVVVAIIVTWVFCIAFSIFFRMFRSEASYPGCSDLAVGFASDEGALASGILCTIMCVALFPLYVLLLRTAAKQVKAIRNLQMLGVIRSSPTTMTLPEDTVHDPAVKARMNLKALQRMAGVFICFYICWTPYTLISLIGPRTVDQWVLEAIACLLMLNSAANFAVYALADREFRAAVARLMRIKTSRVSDSSA